jgi:chemotaxis protein methyltransferase CheR
LLAQDRLNPAIHFYQALIFENLGIADEAEKSLRRAIYLDRNFALAHYHLGVALQRDRKPGLAARSFENVLQVLAGLPGEAIITAGPGLTVTHLKELANMHLQKSSRATEVVAL